MCASLAHNTVLHPGESMKNVALGQEEIPFCALSLLTMTSLRNPWQVLQDTAQAISSDGAYVPLVSGEWAEVRTAAIGEVETHTSAQGKAQVKVTQLSYFSRVVDADTFEQLAEVELRRRGVRKAQAICAVTDGAVWLQHFIDLHRPDAVRILDFPHAAEYVSAIGEAVRASGLRFPSPMPLSDVHPLN